MDQKPNYQKIKKIAKEFSKELSKNIAVSKVVLFGSYAKGTASSDSDIDLVFISSSFNGMDGLERFAILDKARKNYEYPMDYFGFTPEEYEKASYQTTLGEVKETGKVIYP